ncbi:hypothetical protein LSH36_1889g00004 [Paralvinella palmiformis]|uniref:Fibronectin type-III domain-containing protein n=1 Tax=Paralvinella palmiformis TaxID=53620 RepID=A0AAD9MQJ7_9ANNE|nr:hypothetical protein LSH36_1889g00004 [Paralvinella palmiformis]
MLTLSDINILDSGIYQCQVDNGVRGSPVSLNTNIIVYGPPSKPVNFHVIDVTAVSIRVQWIRGFNGGLDQTFTIRYTDVVSGVVKEKSGIEDKVVGSGQMITDDITDGIEPETEYQLQIFADNLQGQVVGDKVSAVTPG